jgi:hypothetical protein
LAGKLIFPPSCMAMVFFNEPWYLRRNKYLFSYEVLEFQILESEFQFSDSPDIGISKKNDRNLLNRKWNWNSAYNGGPRNWNQKLEFPTKFQRIHFFWIGSNASFIIQTINVYFVSGLERKSIFINIVLLPCH